MTAIGASSIAFAFVASTFLDSLLPVGWEQRLAYTILFLTVIYMYGRIEKLERKVEQLDKALDTVWKRTGGAYGGDRSSGG